ncbi:AAA family ATPase [Sphingomonadaceae bacterium OTU29LAMAA1]|nr:AAA family ATPase [Sphingomonadaceae bacterium OTU29LAMAA1]
MPLRTLTVFGIFDHQDIEFDFFKSPCFLVGPNGTGKSTALKVLHNVLTAQWTKLRNIPFAGIVYDTGAGAIVVDKLDLIRIQRLKTELIRRSPRGRKGLFILPASWGEAANVLTNRQSTINRRFPPIAVPIIDAFAQMYESVRLLVDVVESESVGKVLYFPTYRRVERDLSELLNDDTADDDEIMILPQVVDRFEAAGEVVGFGGQDISQLLEASTNRVNEAARKALNEHSVRFLQIIATGEKIDLKPVKALVTSPEQVDHLLTRIAAFAPLSLDLLSVKSAIAQIAVKMTNKKTGRRGQHEDTLLIYLAALLSLFDNIDDLAVDLRTFARLIESYLGPLKHARLQEIDNKILITDKNGNALEPEQLSSGEKQILAFFAFLLLKSDVHWKYIIIDEPELSLSVSWQKTLIRDILESRAGTHLIAATHSPFIFESYPLDNVVTLGVL